MNLLDLIGGDTTLCKVASTHGGEYAGPCPLCGGRDRFRVWPHDERPGYWCRQCSKKGDGIQYLRDRDGLSFAEACDRLSIPQREASRQKQVPELPRLSLNPGPAWQAQARQFTQACEDRLWTSVGAKALDYLHQRGLCDETIRAARIGYHPAERLVSREVWGLSPSPNRKKCLWLPRGIVFPWAVGDELWRVIIRRVGDQVPKHKKYVSISGGGNTLYRVETLQPNAPAIIVEGVLDALAIAQEAVDLIAVVAAGSTTGGRLERWIGRVAFSSIVLVAFDADEAGEAAAAWWLNALGTRAKRWRPYWDDPNAMLKDGADLRTWVREGMGTEPKWWREVATWPAVQREQWAERAAIMELDGGLVRREAEACAFDLVVRRPALPGQGVP
jgi:DNA primase